MPSPTQSTGFGFEAEAEAFLQARGYRVVARNWRGGGGEVDRIAWDGEVLCFVEVRSRRGADHGRPAETVGKKKQQKVVRAALAFLCQEAKGRWPMVRFDVVAIVALEGRFELFQNAFDAGSGAY